MTFPQESCKRAFDQAAAAGISLKPTESKFTDKLIAWMPSEGDERKLIHQLISALERTLNRNHDDSRLILSLCTALQESSGLAMHEFQKKLTRTLKFLDKPAAATVVKTIKTSAAAALHPKVIEIRDLDAIEALARAPEGSIQRVEGEAEIIQVGTEAIHLAKSDKKEIVAAVRKAKAETKKTPVATEVRSGFEEPEEPEEQEELEVSDELNSELDEAAIALSRLLRTMPRTGRLSGLAQVIEQAQKLLELTRRDLALMPKPSSPDEGVPGSLN